MKTNSIKINNRTHTIEISKQFEKASSYYGTDEYNDLRQACRDFPNYKVVVRKTKATRNDHSKGLSYEYMEKYIANHDDDEGTIMAIFKDLRGESELAKELNADSCSYNEIKEWFFNTFPEISSFFISRDKILGLA